MIRNKEWFHFSFNGGGDVTIDDSHFGAGIVRPTLRAKRMAIRNADYAVARTNRNPTGDGRPATTSGDAAQDRSTPASDGDGTATDASRRSIDPYGSAASSKYA